MPLFEIDASSELVPFRRLRGGPDLYEKAIEDLLWENLDEFTGDALFPVARQTTVATGGIPDIVALNARGDVVVVEVKRDIDRNQLAQCLEYAGWARSTNLDQLSSMYHRGQAAFFGDWQAFTDSAAPIVLSRRPRLILVARDFQGRTESAFEFLVENGLPVKLIRVVLYEDSAGRRFLDVEGEHEPELPVKEEESEGPVNHTMIYGRRVRVADLLEADLLQVGDELTWNRPRMGKSYRATVRENGSIELSNGRAFSSPSRAAMEAAEIPACDGWYAWRSERMNGRLLNDLRIELATRVAGNG